MKKIALIMILLALALVAGGCVVVTWERSGHRSHSVYVSARSTDVLRVVRLPEPPPSPRTESPWDETVQ